MIRIAFLLSISVLMFSCSNTESNGETGPAGFSVSGKIMNLPTGKVSLNRFVNNDYVLLDTCSVKEGVFQFSGKIESPEMTYIAINDGQMQIPVFLENADISVEADLRALQNAKVTGSKSHDLYVDYNARMAELKKEIDDNYQLAVQANQAGQQEVVQEYAKKIEEASERQDAYVEQFIVGNTGTMVAALVAAEKFLFTHKYDVLQNVYNSIAEKYPNSPYTKAIGERVAILEKVAIGKEAPDFTYNSPDGNPISLSDFRGKYVLVDFWASWCGPCRKENPNIVGIYNDYKDKNFDVLGVSLDKDQKKWKQAIEADGLTWNHVSDLKGWDCQPAKLYGASSIPHAVLVDPNGVIVAKDLRGDDLRNKLAELIDG